MEYLQKKSENLRNCQNSRFSDDLDNQSQTIDFQYPGKLKWKESLIFNIARIKEHRSSISDSSFQYVK